MKNLDLSSVFTYQFQVCYLGRDWIEVSPLTSIYHFVFSLIFYQAPTLILISVTFFVISLHYLLVSTHIWGVISLWKLIPKAVSLITSSCLFYLWFIFHWLIWTPCQISFILNYPHCVLVIVPHFFNLSIRELSCPTLMVFLCNRTTLFGDGSQTHPFPTKFEKSLLFQWGQMFVFWES